MLECKSYFKFFKAICPKNLFSRSNYFKRGWWTRTIVLGCQTPTLYSQIAQELVFNSLGSCSLLTILDKLKTTLVLYIVPAKNSYNNVVVNPTDSSLPLPQVLQMMKKKKVNPLMRRTTVMTKRMMMMVLLLMVMDRPQLHTVQGGTVMIGWQSATSMVAYTSSHFGAGWCEHLFLDNISSCFVFNFMGVYRKQAFIGTIF